MLTRRTFVLASLGAPLARVVHAQTTLPGRQTAAPERMLLSIHQNTSRAAGFRGSLEGWARAGIRYVELNDRMLDGFLENDTLAGARNLLNDLGLTPVSAAAVMQDIWIPGPARATSLETWRRRCEQFAGLGLERICSPGLASCSITIQG